MTELTLDSLWQRERYLKERDQFRDKVMQQKKLRKVSIGQHLTLLFENRQTVFYQIMEMLRIENKWDDESKLEELQAYNPLSTTPDNLKATLLVEYEDASERHVQLGNLRGIEDQLWYRLDDGDKILAIADEDMERSDEQKTSAVHFLRYPVTADFVSELRSGKALVFGCDHPHYHLDSGIVDKITSSCLADDLQGLQNDD